MSRNPARGVSRALARPPFSSDVPSDVHSKLTSGIVEIDFAKNCFRKMDAVDAPAPLRRYFRRSVIEILVVCLQESIVDFVQLVVEDLLRSLVPMRSGVGAEQDAILIPVKKLLRRAGLPAQLSNAGRNIDRHIREAVKILRDIRQVLAEVSHVQHHELRFRMSGKNPVAGLE